MTKKRFIISIILGLLLFTSATMVTVSGSFLSLYLSIPSFIMSILIPIILISFNFTPSNQIAMIGEILSTKESVDNNLITLGINYLKTFKVMVIFTSISASLIGVIGMMANLEDVASVGRNLAVALITLLYGSIFVVIYIQPLIGAAKNKQEK